MDKRVIAQIRSLVEAGCDSVEEIQKELDIFVKTDLGITEDTTSGKRFFAKPQDIRNHVHIAMKSLV